MTIAAAIIGAGRTGGWHEKELAGIHDVQLVGIADVRRDAAEALAVPSGAEVFTDYREMLEDLRPDVVYLCTPAGDHLAQARFAAERGINLFVEKPLATNVADAMAIADLVEQHGVLCSVGYQWRYNPATDAALEALADLTPTLLAGWWYWTIPPIPWIKDRRWGGGQIFDQATHLIDLMRYVAGDISTVYAAYAQNARSEEELPNWDANAVTFGFKGGAVGTVHTTYALFPGIPNSNGVDIAARELLVRVNLGKVTIFRRDAEPVEVNAPAGWNISQPFIAALRTGDAGAIRSSAREGALSIAVSLAANYSATTGNIVTMDDFVASPPDDVPIMPNEEPPFDATPE